MRFIHTADWHLGRTLHGVSLLEDQAHALEQFLGIVAQERPDFVLIAGDIYDRAAPPYEAVQLLDEILCRLVLDLKQPTLIIAGNHDSAERLGFCSRLLREKGLHIAGVLEPEFPPVTIRTPRGEADIFLAPYADPAMHRQVFREQAIHDHDSAMGALMARVNKSKRADRLSVLAAHAFVAGCEPSESERPLTVGGTGVVSAAHFGGFDYVALGHLHRRQEVGEGKRVHYSGSILKYSFSEEKDAKSVIVTELAPEGPPSVRDIALSARRPLGKLRGKFKELMQTGRAMDCREHYLWIDLTDDEMILDPMGQLRQIFPNLLHINREFMTRGEGKQGAFPDHRKIGPEAMFRGFYDHVQGQEPEPEKMRAFESAVEEVRKRGTEGEA